MKKIVLPLTILALTFTSVNAQETEPNIKEGYNRWSIDVNGGINKPTTPFTTGAYTSRVSPWHADLGVRYMFNPKFGLKADAGYDYIRNHDDIADFRSKYYRANLQGVANLGRILNFEDWTSMLNLQFHTGLGYSQLRNKDKFSGADEMMNFIVGFTGQVKLSDRIALNADFTMINNINQNRSFDGGVNTVDDRGFNGTMYNATVGLSIYLGRNQKHADWYTEQSAKDMSDVEERLASLEKMLLDSDNDGVADYLDLESNTPAGALVDSKGRAIDKNNNGVPDYIESYLDGRSTNTNNNQTNNQLVKDLINGGYVTTYFDFNKTQPTNVSTAGIDFILTYLRNNPSSSVEIYGFADELGTNAYNNKLSNNRATNVKNVLTKAGIDSSRLKVIARGEDNSVDKNSDLARKLVRRVIFKVN